MVACQDKTIEHLSQLLNECKSYIEKNSGINNVWTEDMSKVILIEKINEVLK